MDSKARISSILTAQSLSDKITGFPTFELSKLDLQNSLDIEIPTNVRLGHLTEKVVSRLIHASSNYSLLYENSQIIENNQTIGELDFILEEVDSQNMIHLELAYKFYLFDPSISNDPIQNWIGPNRNDSLVQKLEKLKSKQFPLLYHRAAKSLFPYLNLEQISQECCLLVSLFLPYGFEGELDPDFTKAVKGHYVNMETFSKLDHSNKSYHIPTKKEWGIDPSDNVTWVGFDEVEKQIRTSLKEKQSPLCWQKEGDSYTSFFIVWWADINKNET